MNAQRYKVQLIGYLGTEPEIRTTESGKKMARMSLATHESYKNAGGDWVKDTQWHYIVAWGKTAELIEQVIHKGSEVLVEGKLVNRQYVDKSGIKKYVTEIVAANLLLLEKTALNRQG